MSAFKNLELANDVMNFAQKLDFDYLLEDLLKCESEVEFAEYCIFLENTNLENPEKFISDLSIWERAILRDKAKEKYGV
tara:strand:- start:2359 stop:2595 length:237 start_codon:yes stop_codon:yes gene_type:complete